MSFWDVVWFICITFAFVAYLMVIFLIISDLFRDRESSGWAKALWVLALIFLPVITSLAYLLIRGRGMSERAATSAERAKQERESYIREVAAASGNGGPSSPADQIAKARALLDSGTISQQEYERIKEKALV